MALRLFCLLILLALPACYKTVLPRVHVSGSQPAYQVQPGDTLYNIARRYGVAYRLLARRNHIRYPYTIYVGQRLYLNQVAPRPSYLPVPEIREKAVRRTKKRAADKTAARHAAAMPGRHKASASGFRGRSLRWPVRGKVTGRFGRRRGRTHDGIDISAPEGTPVRAAATGDVVYADHRLTGYGKLIIIRHSRDMFTAYAHNQRNLVRRGDRVKRGEMIARVGHTGHTKGSNLHFEVRRGPTPVNPVAYLPKR